MSDALTMSKGRRALVLLALFLSSITTMGDLVITPITYDLFNAFPDASEELVGFSITGPALIGVPFCFISGWLCDRLDKKWIIVFGFATFTVCSNLSLMVDSIYYFIAMRCLTIGIGWGVTGTAALAILADISRSDDEHGKYVGWYNSVMSLLGASIAVVAGALAVGAWQGAFYVYWIAIPILVMLVVFVPSLKPSKTDALEESTKTAGSKARAGWWKKLVPLSILVLVVNICYMQTMYTLAIYVTEAGLGDSSFAGILSGTLSLSTMAASLTFGYFYAKMKNAVYLPALFIIGTGFILMALFPSQIVAIACCVVMGFMWAFFYCYVFSRCTELVPEDRAGTSTGVMNVVIGLGCLLTVYVFFGLSDAFNTDSVGSWLLIGVLLIITAAVATTTYFVGKKKKASNENIPNAD